MTRSRTRALTLLTCTFLLSAPMGSTARASGSETGQAVSRLVDAAEEAYIFGYPLILMDETRNSFTEAGQALNTFLHVARLATPEDRSVIRPNIDTLYSTAWLDLSREPMILHVPDTQDRYDLLPMFDAYTNIFASPGKRTTGTSEQDFAIVGPDFRGPLPTDLTRIDAPTNLVWILGRIQVNGESDLPAVRQLQSALTLMPLSAFIAQEQPESAEGAVASSGTFAPQLGSAGSLVSGDERAWSLDAPTFFERLATLLGENPPSHADHEALETLASIGVVPGQRFSPSAEVASILEEVKMQAQRRIMDGRMSIGELVNGWKITREGVGSYGTNYLLRASVAKFALGTNLPVDAIYALTATDENGHPLDTSRSYLIHFEADELPPINGFWSITLYDDEGFLVPNTLNRYGVGDRDALRFNDDGSLDIYIRKTSPGMEYESNWLPAPERGTFNLTMRLYWPRAEALDGRWSPASIRDVSFGSNP